MLETQRRQASVEKSKGGEDLKPIRSFCLALALAGTLGAIGVRGQEAVCTEKQGREMTSPWALEDSLLPSHDSQEGSTTPAGKSPVPDAPPPKSNPGEQNSPDDQFGKQPKRILWVIPNYRAVSANTQLPPLSFKSEMWLATEDTFDYSDFVFVGALAGIAMAGKSQPSFGQGGAGYGRYYWHIFVDGAIENYMTEAIVPAVTREDPRYYTMGKGGFSKRTGYAVSRLFITRTEGGNATVNLSEIIGAGAAAGIGNTYYHHQSNPWVKTYQRWGTQVGLDGVFNVLKEFWPDINRAIFHGKY
jgi:hypothetical protein